MMKVDDIQSEDYEEFEDFYDYTYANEHPLTTSQRTSTGELQLADGRILGHRDYVRYYKQNLGNANEKRECMWW